METEMEKRKRGMKEERGNRIKTKQTETWLRGGKSIFNVSASHSSTNNHEMVE